MSNQLTNLQKEIKDEFTDGLGGIDRERLTDLAIFILLKQNEIKYRKQSATKEIDLQQEAMSKIIKEFLRVAGHYKHSLIITKTELLGLLKKFNLHHLIKEVPISEL